MRLYKNTDKIKAQCIGCFPLQIRCQHSITTNVVKFVLTIFAKSDFCFYIAQRS